MNEMYFKTRFRLGKKTYLDYLSLNFLLYLRDLTPNQIDGTASLPSCSYEILSASTNLPIHFANVGEQLIHRWACDSGITSF